MKNYRIPLLIFVFLIAICSTITSCSKDKMSDEVAAQWVESHTTTLFGSNSELRVTFFNPILEGIEDVDKYVDVDVKGKAYKIDDYTIGFKAEKSALGDDKMHSFAIDMNKLTGAKVPNYSFEFRFVARHNYQEIERIIVDEANEGCMRLEGMITLFDKSDVDQINSSFFSGDFDYKDVEIKPTANTCGVEFAITGIKRGAGDKSARMTFDASSLGYEQSLAYEFTIPSKDEFKVLGCEIDQKASNAIVVTFSQPLNTAQSLAGLVTITGVKNAKVEKYHSYARISFDKIKDDGNAVVTVSDKVKSTHGSTLGEKFSANVKLEKSAPEVVILDEEMMLPDPEHAVVTFKARNVFAVDVNVMKIYTGNVLRFLQDDNEYNIKRYARRVYRNTVRLDSDPSIDIKQWNTFTADISGLVKNEPGALYKVYISFTKEYSAYDVTGDTRRIALNRKANDAGTMDSYFDNDGYMDIGDVMGYTEWVRYWDDDPTHDNGTDPAKDNYYKVADHCLKSHTFMASNLGVTAKMAEDKKVWVAVADILTAEPTKGVTIKAYNNQLQVCGEAKTDNDGLAMIDCKNLPYFIVAEKSGVTTYLKLNSYRALSYSKFNVGGEVLQKGVKAFIYGDRGVWRPGDTLHMSVMVEDADGQLPDRCPVTMELYNPRQQCTDRQTSTKGCGGLYVFHIPTYDTDETGSWRVVAEVGGRKFTKSVRIAAIKPNRLKINVKTDAVMDTKEGMKVDVQSKWLSGPVAQGLKCKSEITLSPCSNPFTELHPGYSFSLFDGRFQKETKEIGEAILDGTGHAVMEKELKLKDAPGMLNGLITTHVFEKGGDESFITTSVKVSPFASYVGVKSEHTSFETDTKITFPVVAVDATGKVVNDVSVQYSIFKVEWNWWQEYDESSLMASLHGSSAKIVNEGTLNLANGRAKIQFEVQYPSYGRYVVLVQNSYGHTAGSIFEVDWPASRGMANRNDPTSCKEITFSMDKSEYNVGDEATIYIPSAPKNSRTLVSIEKANKVISQEWVETSSDVTPYKVKLTNEMIPNCHVSISMISPYEVSESGYPMRRYGVMPITVNNLDLKLEPQITMKDSIWPQRPFEVKISEKKGKTMHYTLAIVDEGLLDISAFNTPDPWTAMNKREALNVKTWDVYDDIVGKKTGRNVLSIGGDEDIKRQGNQKDKRFNPVVAFYGPYTLEGGTNKHNITLPMYVGSVRVMVVACDGKKGYGSADKTVNVSSPLMILSSLPRILSCGEDLELPVNVFSTLSGAQNVTVSASADGPISINGAKNKNVSFKTKGDAMVSFRIKTDPKQSGISHIHITAKSPAHTASEDIAIEVRNPQPVIISTQTALVSQSSSKTFDLTKADNATLSLSTLPMIDLGSAFIETLRYPYNCSEQISTRMLFMLYSYRYLDEQNKKVAAETITSLISSICERQLPNGAFCYWPGYTSANEWVTSLAGHAMLEAEAQGYKIPANVLSQWKTYQTNKCKAYNLTGEDQATTQAYRLYTLALAKDPDNASMNKLKEDNVPSVAANSLLASAYSLCGKTAIAKQILTSMPSEAPERAYSWSPEWTFGSKLRDKALRCEAVALVKDEQAAMEIADQIVHSIDTRYSSTSERAHTMIALSTLGKMIPLSASGVSISQNGKKVTSIDKISEPTTVVISPSSNCTISLSGNGSVYANLCTSYQPSATEHVAASAAGISMDVKYYDKNFKPIDISSIKQGDEVRVSISVTSHDASDSRLMALRHIWAAGFEPWEEAETTRENCEFRDQRDDRTVWHFTLRPNSTEHFTLHLRAAYAGTYLQPSTLCEDMYDARINAHTASSTVKISK